MKTPHFVQTPPFLLNKFFSSQELVIFFIGHGLESEMSRQKHSTDGRKTMLDANARSSWKDSI